MLQLTTEVNDLELLLEAMPIPKSDDEHRLQSHLMKASNSYVFVFPFASIVLMLSSGLSSGRPNRRFN